MARPHSSGLPAAAIELGTQIAESAPPVSDALMAELRLIMHGSAGMQAEPQPDSLHSAAQADAA